MDAEVELVTRGGCPLCGTTLTLLRLVARGRAMRIVISDVDREATLRAAYDLRVPVVRIDGRVVAEGVVTADGLRRALDGAGIAVRGAP